MSKVRIPKDYDYVGVYLTDKCHLRCHYCITAHHNSSFGKLGISQLSPDDWIEGLNRLELPEGVPVTLQGGEPFLYKGIWQILEKVRHKIDILTALPPFVTKERFLALKTLEWNKRKAPYPTIRVSYHKGQNDYKELIERIAKLHDTLSIGLYYLEHPAHSEDEIAMMKEHARRFKVELRPKEFLGEYKGKIYGEFLYPDAVRGMRQGRNVLCKNTVVPVAPDGTIYRCHSDLYFNRRALALGNILDDDLRFPDDYLGCDNYGLCSGCDVKIKTNHHQEYGYTSVDIKFMEVMDESKTA
ncbi:MAG: radical SAM protein [Candidatus Omnitrophica bacterium]|nr:radical SAM protein [Candidatus Omnitrophota bacterium]